MAHWIMALAPPSKPDELSLILAEGGTNSR